MPRIGNIVGEKYRLIAPLGEGSMGVVWKAFHETLQRPFAVKFLKEQAQGDDGVCLKERFFSEARLSAGVRHPNVVAVLDTGVTDEGTPYMVMEYLEGESLAQRLDRGPALPVTEFLRLMITTLAGMEAVHRAGILHRDLKPENIVLCPEYGEVVPKLVDFGISRLLDVSEDSQIRRLTFPGTTLGTPWYMAPEQAQALHTVDQRVDIYAFGVVLYEALSGRLPFEHDNIQMLLLLVAAGGAPPLACQRPDLPPALAPVVDRCLATDPAMRFDSASALAAALSQVLPQVPAQALCQRRGQPLRLSQVGAPTTAGPPPSRNPTLPAALARLGFVRMPPRPVLLGAGAVVVTGLFALLAVAHLPEASATAPPALAAPTPPSVERASPRPPRPTATLTSTSSTAQAASEIPTTDESKPRRSRRRPPEMFRDPGF